MENDSTVNSICSPQNQVKLSAPKFVVGDVVAVKYTFAKNVSKFYVALVNGINIVEGKVSYDVSFMKYFGQNTYIMNGEDSFYVDEEEIMCKLDAVANRRGNYSIHCSSYQLQ